jgi:integrase
VAFFTGLRRGDVFALAKADIDLARGVITATISKGQKSRVLPIHEALRPYLDDALKTPGPRLFPWPRGKRLPNLVKILRRACGRAGLVTGYELRCRRRRACGWSEVHAAEDVPDACPSCGRDSVYARPIPRRITFHGLRHSFGKGVVAAGGTGAGQALLAHSIRG